MKKFFLVGLSFLFALSLVGIGFGIWGYYSHKLQLNPVYDFAERAERKGRRMLNLPTKTVGLVDTIDTIYVRLRGKSYLMPDNDFRNGGGLTVWGDDILVIHKSGRILFLKEEALTVSNVTVPDNGLDDYVVMAAEKYPGRPSDAARMRYNDLEWIDEGALRGFAVSYTYVNSEDECYGSRIAWLPVGDDVQSIRDLQVSAEDWDVIFETAPCLAFNESRELMLAYMAGGRIAFKAPNLLYMGQGEYHLDGLHRPDAGIQSDDSDYGKTIEINLETGLARHFSKGHRNLQGVVIDRDGRLWTTEHGMRGGDELNLVKDGGNYGWPLENLGTLYSKVPAPSASGVGRHEVYDAPAWAWLPSAAVSALGRIDGFHEAWDGDLLVASLKNRTLYRARIRDERVMFLEEIYIGQRIRDVMQYGPDKIALWLDTNELVVFEVEERANPVEGMEEALIAGGMSTDLAHDTVATFEGCTECHSLEENVHGAGPSLYGLFEKSVASTAFLQYSSELKSHGGVWSEDRLKAYLAEPGAVVPGTSMTGLGLGGEDAAGAMVEGFKYLKAKQDGPSQDI